MKHKETVLITGGCGYIGSHLVNAFRTKYQIVVIDNLSTGDRRNQQSGVIYEIGDMGDIDFLREIFNKYTFTLVVHLAAKTSVEESMLNPALYFKENTQNSALLMEFAIDHHVRHFIFSSVGSVYGNVEKQPIAETCEPAPLNIYAESKAKAEQMLRELAQQSTIDLTIFRYFNVCGNHLRGKIGDYRRHATCLIQKIALLVAKNDNVISIYGNDYETADGTCIRDYVHVEDVVNAHGMLINAYEEKKSVADVYNVGYGKGLSSLEVIRLFNNHLTKELAVKILPKRSGAMRCAVVDPSKLKSNLGWVSLYDYPEDVIVQSALKWARKVLSQTH